MTENQEAGTSANVFGVTIDPQTFKLKLEFSNITGEGDRYVWIADRLDTFNLRQRLDKRKAKIHTSPEAALKEFMRRTREELPTFDTRNARDRFKAVALASLLEQAAERLASLTMGRKEGKYAVGDVVELVAPGERAHGQVGHVLAVHPAHYPNAIGLSPADATGYRVNFPHVRIEDVWPAGSLRVPGDAHARQ